MRVIILYLTDSCIIVKIPWMNSYNVHCCVLGAMITYLKCNTNVHNICA